jgi:SAM-dependent methyltransferase
VSKTSKSMLAEPTTFHDDRCVCHPPHSNASECSRPGRHVVGPDAMYRHVSAGHVSWISDRSGTRRPLPIARWLGGPASTNEDREGDEAMLELCQGPTMDVGCGPGRLTAALAARGVPVLGVDISATAVAMTAQRGAPALQRDVFDAMPGGGHWSRVLLADGNIGIGGDPLRMLRRARHLLHPRGQVVAEIEARTSGICTSIQRWETDHCVGRWFPWAHVGSDAARSLADAAGLLVTSTVERSDRCIVAMRVR